MRALEALGMGGDYGAVDGARAANLFGEVVDDSLGWRRDAALAFDEQILTIPS